MKVLRKFILVLTCVFSIVLLAKGTLVYGNHKVLDPNTWYNFTLHGGTTSEYIFKMPSSGYFYYEVVLNDYLQNGEVVPDSSWQMPLRMTVNYKNYEDTTCYKSDGVWRSHGYSFKKGTRVQLDFISTSGSEYKWNYKVRVVVKHPSNFEKENNNSKSQANRMSVGKTYTGLVMKDDTDWFVFKAPRTGKYKIAAVNTDTTNSSNINAYVYNDGYKLLESGYLAGGNGWATIYHGELKKGEKVYIKVPCESWYDVFYKLSVKAVK